MRSASGLLGQQCCRELLGLLCTISSGRSGLGVTGGKGQSTAMCWVCVIVGEGSVRPGRRLPSLGSPGDL